MPVDPTLQADVLAACQTMRPPDLPTPPTDAAAHHAQAVLLLPSGAVVDQHVAAEMVRLGVTLAVTPGEDGQSRLHEAAAQQGRDATQPLLWIVEVTYDETTRVLVELDLGVSAPVALTATWADVGRPKLLTLADAPGTTLRVSFLLDGDVELQLLEDGIVAALSPALHAGTATLHQATVVGERGAGQHVYGLQARGTGTLDAASLAVVASELVQREPPTSRSGA